ncbi:histidine kinase [Streptomyces sp. NPDC093252]|uniref:sensor histidine kinase n=1 Tax=Streptomyces sp. NPDC093252 TaxID=3154980 RepID=UPI003428859A
MSGGVRSGDIRSGGATSGGASSRGALSGRVGPGPVTPPGITPRLRLSLDHLSHLLFFLVVGAGLVGAARFALPLCLPVVTFSALLALAYAGGPALLGRWLGAAGRAAWVPLLVVLWGGLLFVAPPVLTPAYVWCAVPLACAALRVLGPRRATAAVAGVTAVTVAALVRADPPAVPELVILPVAAVWGTVALYRAQQRDAAVRQRLLDELRATRDVLARQQRRAGVEAERARIARDLHDTLAQDLSGGLMLLQAAERDWDARPDVARTRVRAVADGLDANLAETRRILRDLTASGVEARGLDDALRALCARSAEDGTAARVSYRSATGTAPRDMDPAHVAPTHVAPTHIDPTHVDPPPANPPPTHPPHTDPTHTGAPHIDPPHTNPPRRATAPPREPEPPPLDHHAATALLRVARSTLANIREHAAAVEVTVTLRHGPDRVVLEVRDDGVGFDPDRPAARPGRGLGLPAARARLGELGGGLRVTSAPGRGTTVRAWLAVPGHGTGPPPRTARGPATGAGVG